MRREEYRNNPVLVAKIAEILGGVSRAVIEQQEGGAGIGIGFATLFEREEEDGLEPLNENPSVNVTVRL
jgi:hypothetical protein